LKILVSLPLKRPDAFSYGVLSKNFINGVLLFGPPGTGKTMLAKAVAKESGARVLEIKGSEVYDMYVGEGEKNVKVAPWPTHLLIHLGNLLSRSKAKSLRGIHR
jgi:SpoVK/Ycf46/Vps4 family AAA+-type ATPase